MTVSYAMFSAARMATPKSTAAVNTPWIFYPRLKNRNASISREPCTPRVAAIVKAAKTGKIGDAKFSSPHRKTLRNPTDEKGKPLLNPEPTTLKRPTLKENYV